jgi:hypothetical protein
MLPDKLAEFAYDRVKNRFPVQYQRNAIASTLASKLVYQEGIHIIEHQADRDLADRAFQYYRESNEVNALADVLAQAEWAGVSSQKKAEALRLLRAGGPRTSMGIF